ncbi:OmpH family outer membrane protein [Elusimicrobiota bacterium]
MIKTKIKLITLILVAGVTVSAHSLMITSTKIAYVNIEEIFTKMKKVNMAKKNLKDFIQERKTRIEETEKAIASVERRISGEDMPPEEVEEFTKMLVDKKAELKELMEESKRVISVREDEFKYEIMGDIYNKVREIAEIQGYTVILEKEVILFSMDSVTDITDEVLRGLNGE